MNKIFCFINSVNSLGHIPVAIAEDGEVLAQHCSSSAGYAKHDIGIGSTIKHDIYKAKYPEGYELVWLEGDQLQTNTNFRKACELNAKMAQDAS